MHREVIPDVAGELFIKDIQRALGTHFVFREEDFSDFGTHDRDLIYVRTGGTEGIFKKLGLKGDIRLLTSGKSNSLAASMEILSYIRKNGGRGEILHGSAEYISGRITSELDSTSDNSWIKTFHRGMADDGHPAMPPMISEESRGGDRVLGGGRRVTDLGGIRLGVIGHPSDWLISSDVDYAEALRTFNAQILDVPMDELLAEIRKFKGNLRSFEGSEAIYDALRTIVTRYNLGGLTIRCFDLLDTVHNTGCLALARLNAEGIPSSCEGDIPALISMAIAQKLTGCPGFQCNLSRVDGDELLFAHCTVPLTMLSSYRYATHFESGIGTAIKGELPEGPVTIFKISPDLKHYVAIPGEIVRNQSEPDLCRTQIIVKAAGAGRYFLTATLANHHIVVPGNLPLCNYSAGRNR